MNHLTVDPATLSSVAASYGTIADDIGSAMSRLDAGDVGLAAVFGVVGTEFVAAAESTTRRYRDRVTELADEAHRISARVRAAGADYHGTDESTGADLGAVTGAGSGSEVA